jgi:SAM-dependent methyltransferase
VKAPETIPEELMSGYTMDGKAAIEYKYANDCSEEIQKMINDNFTDEIFQDSLKRISNRETNYYGPTDTWLYKAFHKYPLQNLDVCIIGSTHPWYEAMCLHFGAKNVIVCEYSDRESIHKDIKYIKPHEMKNYKFDACVSISSYEHDGLGRYGDPLNPNGDIESMKELKNYLKKDGHLYLSVPTGNDKVVFNVHRVYGKNRFPLLIDGWKLLDIYDVSPAMFQNEYNGVNGSPYQPVFVLRNI